jgi:CRP-like cAMP-binding protein
MKMDPGSFVADPELLKALRAHATSVDCAHDCTLFHQGDESRGLYIFLNGELVLSMKSQSGEEIMSMPALCGSLLGLPGLIGNVPYSLTAIAWQGAEVGFVSKDEFSQLMLSRPAISVMVLRVLAAEVRSARLAMTAA